jgi:hypothetical protein
MPQSADAHIRTPAQRKSTFVPLELEQRTYVDTASAAYHLGRKAKTMRVWTSSEQGPIRPLRLNGRLAWAVTDIKRLLKVGETS